MVAIKYQPEWKKYEKDLHDPDPEKQVKAAEAFELEREHQMRNDCQARRWEESRKESLAKDKPQWVKARHQKETPPDPYKKFKQFGTFESSLRPVPGYLIVEVEPPKEEMSKSGLYIPAAAKEDNSGVVVRVGPSLTVQDVVLEPPCAPGEKILFKKGAGVEMTIKDHPCRFMQFSDVLAIYEEEA